MALGAFWFSVMGLFVRIAGSRGIPVMEIVLIRGAVSLAISWVMLRQTRIPVWGNRPVLLVLRGLLGFGALAGVYYAIVHLPLAEATTIQYTSPVFTALFAAWLLRERVTIREVACVAASLIGVLLIARPAFLFGAGAGTDRVAVVVALCAAFLSGAAYTLVRRLGDSEDTLVIVFYFPLVTVPAALPLAIPEWVWPSASVWLILLGVGVTTQIAQISITRGLRRVPAARASAVGYLQIAFAAIWGAIFLGEIPDLWTIAGATLIVVSTLALSAWRRRGSERTAGVQLTATVQPGGVENGEGERG